MKIIFLGTPDFAVATLNALLQNHFDVVAVVTAPDKLAGRGMNLQQSAVKTFALEHSIPVLQPEKLKDPEFLNTLKSYGADIQVVVAFRMLPEAVWNMPSLGTINLHASLLPQYRGAAPINWVLINGEKVTGVTTFKLQHEIDTGNIMLQKEVPVSERDNAGTLHNKLMKTGALLMVDTLNAVIAGTIVEKPQVFSSELKTAPKIFSGTCKIDWNQAAEKIYNFIRGLSPYPTAFTLLNDKKFKIFETEKIYESHQWEPGKLISDHKSFLNFACADGFISVKILQLEGKKKMAVEDFLRGNREVIIQS